MTTMYDLSGDLVGEILSRVPLTSLSSVRSTCKTWNVLSKNQIFGKAAVVRKKFLGFMVMDFTVWYLRVDLDNFPEPSIKQVSILNQVEIYKVIHCDGLLLCVTKDHSRLVVWNPYLGQIRWIQPGNNFSINDMYTLGYDNNNRNHKILKIYNGGRKDLPFWFEIYDFNSNIWRVFDVNPDWRILCGGMSLNGNTYFFAQEDKTKDVVIPTEIESFLLCFDFTAERFGPRLPLPFHPYLGESVTLSCVREDQLAVLYQSYETFELIEIWITTNIKPNAVSWCKFFKVDKRSLAGFPDDSYYAASFFIDKEKKVAVVSGININIYKQTDYTAYIIGDDGYFNSVKIGEAPNLGKTDKFECFYTPVFSSYAPSLVQLKINQPGKMKERDYYY